VSRVRWWASSQSEECLGCASVAADAQGLLRGGRASVVAAAETPQEVPEQVAVQEPSAEWVVLGGQEVGAGSFEADEFLVAFG
jgi:hypothetical protein